MPKDRSFAAAAFIDYIIYVATPAVLRWEYLSALKYVLFLLYRMAYYCLDSFRTALSRIGQINLVMIAGIANINLISVLFSIFVHFSYCRRLIVVSAEVHTLYAKTFIVC